MDITLTSLAKVVERCWRNAELITADIIARKHPSPSEEQITFLFSGELRSAVDSASRAREIERAFLSDLHSHVPTLVDARRAGGLLARVNVHNRRHEGHVSAADFGVVITRPLVRVSADGFRIEFQRDHATGLLAQAKLGLLPIAKSGRRVWGSLTKPQTQLFPKRRDYYSLLLYRLNGHNSELLERFGWQLCRQHTLRQVRKWLTTDAFPEEITSSEVLLRLFTRTIGTEDPKLIRTIIDPVGSGVHSIEIRIFWPDGKGPRGPLAIQEPHHQSQQALQRMRQQLTI